MGCDIHSLAEVRTNGVWRRVGDVFTLDDWDRKWFGKEKGPEPFDWRHYALFGFLAGVRDADVVQIADKRGLPDDMNWSQEERDEWADSWYHSASWLTAAELLAFNYDQPAEPYAKGGESLRSILGEWFFERLAELAALGAPEDVRAVFWFDN